MQNHIFCFGLGFSALHLAEKLLAKGWRVSGTCRSQEKCDSLRHKGITAQIFEDDLPLQNPFALQGVTHILNSIPPNEDGDIVLAHHQMELESLTDLQWLGYFSTTGVYGDYQGSMVNENSELKPSHAKANLRVIAEQQYLSANLPTQIFRLAGIYGKGRNAIESLKKGTAKRINKPNSFFSRIHVEDIANIVQASFERPHVGEIYNCADNHPCAQEEVVKYAANLIGVEPPKLVDFADADLSQMAKNFYQNSRKVSNEKIKEELRVSLSFPDYKSGLKSCL